MNAHRKAVDRARSRMERAREAVYAAAYPNRNVPLSQCREMASERVRGDYDDAVRAVNEAEAAAVRAGKAWRGSLGSLYWY